VLQVNFRGSGGRGYEFERAGYREWGGKVQDDISDGVKWLIDNHFTDPGRICTFGASFGGYAAMMQPIRNSACTAARSVTSASTIWPS
jgi:dipeptidyl aminopeptidase/acylaminoacyl peptidase